VIEGFEQAHRDVIGRNLAVSALPYKRSRVSGFGRSVKEVPRYLMLARHYSSWSARFRSPDPISLGSSIGGASSYYAYVQNTPMNAIDPSGMNRGETGSVCLAAAGSLGLSVVYGTLTAVSVANPEVGAALSGVKFIAGDPLSLFRKTSSYAGAFAASYAQCQMQSFELRKVDDCIAGGDLPACKEAQRCCQGKCEYQPSHEECQEIAKRLQDLEPTSAPDPGPSGCNQPPFNPNLPCPKLTMVS
jgi:RHS repeat-associated protein